MTNTTIKRYAGMIFRIATVFAIVSFYALPLKAALAVSYTPLTTLPGAFQAGVPVDPVSIIKNIYGVSIGIAAILAVAMIVWAGVEYATTEAIGMKSEAKQKWEGAIWGLVILLGAYIILRTINVSLVTIDMSTLSKPCGPGGTGISCGTGVASDILSAIAAKSAAVANNAVSTLQNAQQSAANAQAAAASIQSQMDALQKQITAASDPTTHACSSDACKQLSDQYETLKSQHDDAVKTAQAATITAKTQAIDTASIQGTYQVTTALNKTVVTDDDISTAKQKLTNTLDAMNKAVADLAQTPGVTTTQINQAVGKVEVVKATEDMNIATTAFISTMVNNGKAVSGITTGSIIANSTGGIGALETGVAIETLLTTSTIKDTSMQQGAVDLRAQLLQESSDAVTAIKAVDPVQAESFRQSALNSITNLDAAISNALGCGSNGYDQSSKPPLACKQ